jgi:hypothetical protein
MLTLAVVLIPLFILFLFLPALEFLEVYSIHLREQSALEAVSLAVAEDLSKIVVNDPYFGYIGLSDFPPNGRATLAGDREPLPITGINTLWTTCRYNLLMAELLDNDYMRNWAQQDIQAAKAATQRLSDLLADSVKYNSKSDAHDRDGNEIKPYQHARALLLANSAKYSSGDTAQKNRLATGLQVNSLNLSLGWLDDSRGSCAPIPEPINMAQLPKNGSVQADYRAFVNLPIKQQDFYFAGLARQATIVNASHFCKPDGKQICSVVRADASLTIPHHAPMMQLITGKRALVVDCAACAVPPADFDRIIPGVMGISFVNGIIPDLVNIRALLDNMNLSRNKTDIYYASGGDYPNDPKTSLLVCQNVDSPWPVPKIIARGLFDWLRATHGKAHLDAVLNLIDLPFRDQATYGPGSRTMPSFFYEVKRNGDIWISNQEQNPFLSETVFENQLYALSFNAFTGQSVTWTMSFRDQVANLGTPRGGKHGGQLMVGNPINWCDLPYFSGNPDLAAEKAKGAKAVGLTVAGTADGCEGGSGAVSLESATFSKQNGSVLTSPLRKSFYSGGLAVDIRFSSPTSAN